jgi:hypothetical protein
MSHADRVLLWFCILTIGPLFYWLGFQATSALRLFLVKHDVIAPPRHAQRLKSRGYTGWNGDGRDYTHFWRCVFWPFTLPLFLGLCGCCVVFATLEWIVKNPLCSVVDYAEEKAIEFADAPAYMVNGEQPEKRENGDLPIPSEVK